MTNQAHPMIADDFDVKCVETCGRVTTFKNVTLRYINEELIGRKAYTVLSINVAAIPSEAILADWKEHPHATTNG